MEPPALTTVIRELGGFARLQDLLATHSREELDAAVAAGRVVRLNRGRYALPGLDEAVAAARSVTGVVSGLSAARHWGWPVKKEPQQPVVTVPRNRAVKQEGVTIHRRDLPAGAVVDGIVTSRVQTVLDCARTLPFDEALAVADSALRAGGLTHNELVAAARRGPRSGRARVLRVVEAADERAANPFESVARALALDVPGLRVEPQGHVKGIGYADLVDRRVRLVIECESWAFHAGEQPFRHDIRRYTKMALDGWLVLRFVWEDVMVQQERVRRQLAAGVALAGRRVGETD